MNDETDEQIGESGISNGCFEFRGTPLEPFSFDRQAAAQRLTDSSSAENALILVFLCLLPIDRVRTLRGHSAVARFYGELAEWADREKITIAERNAGFLLVEEIANRIWKDLEAVDFVPELPSGGAADPNGLG